MGGLNLYVLMGGAAAILGLTLAAFFFFRNAGEDKEKAVVLTNQVKQDAEKLKEVSDENKFRNRIITDADFRDRVLNSLQPNKDK